MNHELNGKNGNVIIYNLRIDRYTENMIETENISYQMFLIKTREIVILARVFFAPKFNHDTVQMRTQTDALIFSPFFTRFNT